MTSGLGTVATPPDVVDLRVFCFLGAPRFHSRPPAFSDTGNVFRGAKVAARLVLAVDGGLESLLDLTQKGRFLPPGLSREWLWVGDGDSLGSRNPESLFAPGALGPSCVELFTSLLPAEKEVSDFGAALDMLENTVLAARGLGAGHVLHLRVEGGLGGRRDHEMCNILEAAEFLERLSRRGITGAVDFDAHVVCFSGKLKWQSTRGASFSLCSLRGTGSLEVSGARYEGKLSLTRGSHGLSNVVEQGEVVAGAGEGGVFLLVSGEA